MKKPIINYAVWLWGYVFWCFYYTYGAPIPSDHTIVGAVIYGLIITLLIAIQVGQVQRMRWHSRGSW